MSTKTQQTASPEGEPVRELTPEMLATATAEVAPWFTYNEAGDPTVAELVRLAALWRARARARSAS